MKRVYNNYFLVGLFTLIIGGVSIFLLLKMSGKNDNADTYHSYFANVTGLGYGNPVYYEGYRVGQIESITPQTNNAKLMFKTEYSVIEGWNIPEDSITKIASSGLLSDTSLNIAAGKSSNFLKPNSQIKGAIGDDIMSTITNLASDFETLNKDKITPLFDLVYDRTDNLTKTLDTQIPQILTSIDVLVKDINKLVKSADRLFAQGNVDDINQIISNLEHLTTQLSATGGWLETSINKVNNLISSGDEMVKSSDLKISELLNITIKMLNLFSKKADTIGNEIESASMNINEATEIIRKNPSNLIFKNKSKIEDENL